ncbi:transposase [Methyloprofundus sedimenti]|uniref:Transposase n=1 Tax=Methyloprofundus sedimenti TaxID=1420851 RepID=A0A1V8M7K4_9GAMM|nr:IS110 family transposase [Methyloprofundus sedimenti]OQK17554.1 transposase [Methyloprofundus sedimenti]
MNIHNLAHLQVAVDIGSHEHYVAIGLSEGGILDEFSITHTPAGFQYFFSRIERQEHLYNRPVDVAMEGYNGWARPLDSQIQSHGYQLYNVNNLKLARFKEIFPAPAKSDLVDTHKMLELFQLQDHLPLAKGVLQAVLPVPDANRRLKRLTRRRRQLINEKVALQNRIQPDLQATCPTLLDMTGSIDNLWFLHFLTCRDDLTKLMRLQTKSLLAIQGVGRKYLNLILDWQKQAEFSNEIEEVGPMIQEDARRLLALMASIKTMDAKIDSQIQKSAYAQHIDSIPGFGLVCSAELAGEIGTLDRFPKQSSFSIYIGMAPLDNQSGGYQGTKSPKHVNTRARKAMMTAVCRHMAYVPESRAYYDKKRSEGKTHNKAVRALGRHISRVIWSMLRHDRDYIELASINEKAA